MSAVERCEEGNESIESIPNISVDGQTLHGELEKRCLVRKFHPDNISMIYQEQKIEQKYFWWQIEKNNSNLLIPSFPSTNLIFFVERMKHEHQQLI